MFPTHPLARPSLRQHLTPLPPPPHVGLVAILCAPVTRSQVSSCIAAVYPLYGAVVHMFRVHVANVS